MTSKKISFLKFVAIISLSIVILSLIAYGSLREDYRTPKMDESLLKETLANPINGNLSFRDSIVSYGMKFLGTPYIPGSSNKYGFDCSGFVYFVFKHYKIQVPRSSSLYRNFGKEIPIDSVKKGDILVFKSPTRNALGHVGIVTNAKGRDSDFIHSSSGIEMKVIITSLKKERYKLRFVKAVDVLTF